MVELRKRKAAPEAPAPPLKKSNSTKAASTKPKLPDAKVPSNGKNSSGITVGQQISLDSFGGEVETNEGEKTSLKKLVGSSSRGVVLFTYPKASTPGCRSFGALRFPLSSQPNPPLFDALVFCVYFLLSFELDELLHSVLSTFYDTIGNQKLIKDLGTTQACLFRDDFTSLTSTGYSIYGLSRDSPKSNTTFQTKHSLPYSLLCDPAATLITAIGMKKAPSGTTRGVFVISKEGIVQATAAGVCISCYSLLANKTN